MAKSLRSQSARLTALLVGTLAFGYGAGGSAQSAENANAPPKSTIGFLLTSFVPAIYYGDFQTDCPKGFEKTSEETVISSLSPKERLRLLAPENLKEWEQKWKVDYASGPNGEHACLQPRSFMNDPRHPAHDGIKGPTGVGLNLDGTNDGKKTVKSCKHTKFNNAEGAGKIDNQFYRALGCTKYFRSESHETGFMRNKYTNYAKDGVFNYLIELTDVDDLRNDPDVGVAMYTVEGVPVLSSTRDYLPKQTLTASPNPRWQNITRGKIVDGVLTTDPIAVARMKWAIPLGDLPLTNEYEFHDMQFKLDVAAGGAALKGVMGAYQPIENAYSHARFVGEASWSSTKRACAGEFKALAQFADGDPDPVTGECSSVSVGYEVEAIPAFIRHIETPGVAQGPSAPAPVQLARE